MISQNTPVPKAGSITFPHLPFFFYIYILKPIGNRKLEIQDILCEEILTMLFDKL